MTRGLQAEGIQVRYGASQAVKNVDIEAAIGEVTCILGRNGVGKTSLLRCLAGQIPAASGQIHWEGRALGRLPADIRARLGLAIVPQGREIFPQLTVMENLRTAYACLPRRQRGIPEHLFELFPVLKEMLQRRGGDLSGGQQQQLAIARALVTRPRLLMLDEPTEGIQPSIIKDIQSVISRLREQGEMAILLVEQYLDFAHALADQYLVLDRGQVVMEGRGVDMNIEEVRRHMTV